LLRLAYFYELTVDEAPRKIRVGFDLGGQVKTGQSWTGQNRPVAGRARRV